MCVRVQKRKRVSRYSTSIWVEYIDDGPLLCIVFFIFHHVSFFLILIKSSIINIYIKFGVWVSNSEHEYALAKSFYSKTFFFLCCRFFSSSFKFRDIYIFLLPFLLLFPERARNFGIFFFSLPSYLSWLFYMSLSLVIWLCVRLCTIYRVGIFRVIIQFAGRHTRQFMRIYFKSMI